MWPMVSCWFIGYLSYSVERKWNAVVLKHWLANMYILRIEVPTPVLWCRVSICEHYMSNHMTACICDIYFSWHHMWFHFFFWVVQTKTFVHCCICRELKCDELIISGKQYFSHILKKFMYKWEVKKTLSPTLTITLADFGTCQRDPDM